MPDLRLQEWAAAVHPPNGAMITTCICHACNWTDYELDGKNSIASGDFGIKFIVFLSYLICPCLTQLFHATRAVCSVKYGVHMLSGC